NHVATATVHINLVSAPPPAFQAPADGAVLSGTVTLSGVVDGWWEPPHNVTIEEDGATLGRATGSTSWSYTLDTRALSNGTHKLTVRAEENRVESTGTVTVSVLNPVSWEAKYDPSFKV